MNEMWIVVLCLIAAVGLALAGFKTTRAGYKSALCTLVRSGSKFEVCDYPALTVVETLMTSSGSAADGSRFAVMRSAGGRNPDNDAQSLEWLRTRMKAEGLGELSPPIYGYFVPPWPPAFLRRNEVMIRIEPNA